MRPSPRPSSIPIPRLAAAAALLLALPGCATARDPARELAARVVWARADRAYLAPIDSTLAPGSPIVLRERGRTIATADVTRLVDAELALARLTTGSLPDPSRLARVRVFAEPAPAPVPAAPDAPPDSSASGPARPEPPRLEPERPSLRVGFPSGRRSSLFFSCTGATVMAQSLLPYRVERLAPDRHRLVRTGVAPAEGWPDTLLVQLFGDVADEEIALERGDIDVAVFWPGEPSTRLRADARWPLAHATRPRGVVVAIWDEADSSAATGLDSLDFTSLDRQLFRGDLGAWDSPAPADSLRPRGTASRRWETARYEVAPSSPGRLALERFLNRGKRALPPGVVQPTVRLVHLDAPADPLDSLALALADEIARSASTPALRARAAEVASRLRRRPASESLSADEMAGVLRAIQVRPLFRIRNPVVASAELQAQLEAMRPEIVRLLVCLPAPR